MEDVLVAQHAWMPTLPVCSHDLGRLDYCGSESDGLGGTHTFTTQCRTCNVPLVVLASTPDASDILEVWEDV